MKPFQDMRLDVAFDGAFHIVEHDLLVGVPPAGKKFCEKSCGHTKLHFIWALKSRFMPSEHGPG